MLTFRSPIAAASLAACTAVLLCACAVAHAGGGDARDRAAVEAVRLDMDSVRDAAAILREAKAPLEQSCLFNGDGEDESLDDCTKKIAAQPQIATTLSKHHMTAMRFALVISALMAGDAGAQTVAEQGNDALEKLAQFGINPQHVRFVQAHRGELDKLFQGISLD